MSYDKNTRNYNNKSGNRRNNTDEQRAREQAYQEYLSLREDRSSRGNYVKNDDLYGSYFSNSNSRRSYDSRDYGSSDYGSSRRYSDYSDRGYSRSEKSRSQRSRRDKADYADYTDNAGYYEEPYRSGSAIDDTPYGTSEMRRRSKREQIARQGRVNKADEELATEEYLKARQKKSKKADKKANKKINKKKKKGRGLRIAVIVVLVFALGIAGVLAAGMAVVKNTLDNVGKVELDPNLIGINPMVDEELSNYRNIAILGIDARDMTSDADTRSDAMIIVSINKETNEIKMFSIYRDTLLYQGEEIGLDKITHAYSYGGPTKTLYTINKNLDLNVKEVVVVNWKSVADTVDALGGIDVEIQESEIDEMNKYIIDTANNVGGSKELIESAGMQTLNGNQAVTYARIRKDAATGDYRRNERMKIVVKATFDKAKELDVKKIKKISKDILPQIKTNMSTADMMGLALNLTSYNMTDSVGFPYDHMDMNNGVFYGVPVTLKSNVIKLHEQFFAQDGYYPTDDVLDISSDISAESGYY